MSAYGEGTAAVLASLWDRFLVGRPSTRGDEMEIVEVVLRTWTQDEEPPPMEIQALSAMTVGLVLPLVLAELVEANPKLSWLTDQDLSGFQEILDQSGISVWMINAGYPLARVCPPTDGSPPRATGTPMQFADALHFIRRRGATPRVEDELAAHVALDDAVREALPVAREVLERIQAGDSFSNDELAGIWGTSLRLLAACRIAAATVPPAAAGSTTPHQDALEEWSAYLMTALLAGLGLRLCAETDDAESRAALPLLDQDDLDLLVEHFEE